MTLTYPDDSTDIVGRVFEFAGVVYEAVSATYVPEEGNTRVVLEPVAEDDPRDAQFDLFGEPRIHGGLR